MLSGYDQFLAKHGVVNEKHIFSEWPGVCSQQIISFLQGNLKIFMYHREDFVFKKFKVV